MFWSSGFWADVFWSPEFWEGQESTKANYIAEVDIDFSKKRSPYRETRELAETWIPKKTRKIIQRVAKEFVEKVSASTQEAPTAIDSTALLLVVLAQYGIDYKRVYDDFLQQQIEAYRNGQLRKWLDIAGIYQQIEDDEHALIMMMMEL